MTTLPQADVEDIKHSLIKAGLSALPLVGGPAAELFGQIITPSLSKRRDIWLSSLSARLVELEAKVDGFDVSRLGGNELFVTTVIQASQIAITTHQVEKLDALRSAVSNCAIGKNPAEDLVLVFLGVIDSISALHIRVLDVIDNPITWFHRIQQTSPAETRREGKTNLYAFATSSVLPHFEQRKFLYEQLLNDLVSRGFVEPNGQNPLANMRAEGRSFLRFSLGQGSGLTPLGREFMRFITDPLYASTPA